MANPVRKIKQKRSKYIAARQGKREVRRLGETEWQYVIETAMEMAKKNPDKYERTLFIISTLYLMYLRISELVATDRWQPEMGHFFCDSQKAWWFKTVGKGNKARIITVTDSMLEALKRWRKHLGLAPLPYAGEQTPLLTNLRSKKGKPLTSTVQIRVIVQECFDNAIAKMIKDRKISAANSLQKATVHWLRHTGISDDINKEMRPVAHVRDDAGHTSIATTELYNDIELKERHASAKTKQLIRTKKKIKSE